ncbi:MAG: large subunit ribosomal protein L13 [Parcubacteria group bacterium Licking1014_17]|nr:MAG: large subunit ribosomal protein L13 [Parcubacteria group bacterium Licking1014_17]
MAGKTYNINAENQILGRLASKIAVLLRGKTSPNYNPREMPKDIVIIENVGKIRFTGTKINTKVYYHYSGYPGGMKAKTLKVAFDKDPKKVLKMAVLRMLPVNKQRQLIIRNLRFK